VRQLKPLRSHLDIQLCHAGYIAAWPAQAGGETELHRIAVAGEHDGNGRGRRLGRERRRCRRGGEDGHLPTNQIGHQGRQAIVLPFRPTEFDREILPIDIPLSETKGGLRHFSISH